MLRVLVGALVAVYSKEVFDDPRSWPRARRLDALALALVGDDAAPQTGTEVQVADLLDRLASYRHAVLAAYTQARPFHERALVIRERVLGPDHPDTALSLKTSPACGRFSLGVPFLDRVRGRFKNPL